MTRHYMLLSEPYTRQLDGKLRELRSHLGGQAVRVTYWITSGRRIVLQTMTRGGMAMSQRSDWQELRSRRMAEPGAAEAYDAARLAFELGRQVRELRVQQGLSQTELARRAGMTQPACPVRGWWHNAHVARPGALARSLGAELTVQLAPSSSVA